MAAWDTEVCFPGQYDAYSCSLLPTGGSGHLQKGAFTSEHPRRPICLTAGTSESSHNLSRGKRISKGWKDGEKEDSQAMLKMKDQETAELPACQITRGVKATSTDVREVHLKVCRCCVQQADSVSDP